MWRDVKDQTGIEKTNESMSDCIFAKSLCSEEGQIVYEDGSTKDDTTCRCDYTRNYSFIKTPRHFCFCIPTEEDCSCYIQSCPVNLTLTTDYACTSNSYKEKPKCMETTRHSKTKDEKTQVTMGKDNLWLNNISAETRRNNTPAVFIVICLCLICICGFTISSKWLRENLQPLKRCFGIGLTDLDHTGVRTTESVLLNNKTVYESSEDDNDSFKSSKEIADVEVDTSLRLDEANYLRIIHLLFRVACPVVRMTFNYEIQPNQLRKTLDKKKALMNKKYRKREKKINDFQWNLLYGSVKGKVISSDGFDIRLMIDLLGTLANIEFGDLYPVQSDKSINAMLSRIKFIRNEATQSFNGKLSEEQFNKYWDDIAQIFKNMTETQWSSDDDWEEIMTAIELDVTGADQPEEAVSIDNTNSVNLTEQTVSTKVKFNQKTDVSVKPDNESTSQKADVTVNPDNELTSQLTDVTVNPDTESTSQKTDVNVNPDTESASQQADVTVNPDTESTSQKTDVNVNPVTESTSEQDDVTFNPDNESTSQQADVTFNPDTESTSEQADVTVNPYPESTTEQADVAFNPDTESTSQQADVTVNPDTESTSQQADVTVNPDTVSTSQQADVTFNPDTESTSQKTDVTVNPDTESTSQQTDVTVNPYTESTSQQADVTFNPDIESTGQHADVKFNPDTETTSQKADVAVNPDTESTSQQADVAADTFNPEYDPRSKETVVTNELLHQDDSIIQVIHKIITINPNDNSTTRQVDITDFTVEHNNTFTTGLADVNNITDQPDDQSTNEKLDATNIRVNPNDDHTSQYADVSYVKCNHVEGSLQQANITNG
ncbi:unnamed protein product [Mytilus coruscus]|uniref:DZIP3-like HEPN domain-containing protein n=1 Tax=Mytilus coruscus TaxID=42192 RepID=A0A6J8EZV4_MYTCO|nr:unnamed protein product [Mytilus coruscus]